MLEFIYRKGVAMQVSAISANCYNIAIHKNQINAQNDKNADKKQVDTAFNSLTPNTNSEKNLADIYKSINEWKDFCHQQILDGKLDIIA